MSRNLQQLPSNARVVSVTSSTGFNPGDYIYSSSSGLVTLSTVTAGTTSTVIAGNVFTSGAVSLSVSALQGPLAISGTYSGTTLTPGVVQNGPITIANNSCYVRCAAMTNGNFAIARASGANIYIRVLSQTGATVVSEITAASNRSSSTSSNFAICGTADGGVALAYANTSNTIVFIKYNSTLTQTATLNTTSISSPGGMNMKGTSSGRIALGVANGSNYCYVFTCASDLTGGYTSTNFNGNNYSSANGWASIGTTTSDRIFTTNYDNIFSGVSIIGTYNSSGGGVNSTSTSYTSGYWTCVGTTDGYCGLVNANGSTLYYSKYSTAPSLISSNNISLSAFYTSYIDSAGAIENGLVNLVGFSNSTTYVGMIASTSSSTFSTPAYNFGTTGLSYYYTAAEMGLNGVTCVVTNSASLTGNASVYFVYGSSQTIANGSTQTGSISYPTYTFYGVAVSGCTAGGTGLVQVAGSAAVNSNYGSASTLTGFSQKGLGSPIANAGNIIGRSLNLEGQ